VFTSSIRFCMWMAKQSYLENNRSLITLKMRWMCHFD
jgi:hypothetical protein